MKKKICLISSSGGHFEQLKMLKKLEDDYDVFWVTEKTEYTENADYFLLQTGLKDKKYKSKTFKNLIESIKIWRIEKPDFVISTGTMVALPMFLLAKLHRKKIIYIETFARVYDGTKAGKIMYKYSDLFIYQWEPLAEVYPEGIFGGSIY